MYPRSYFPCHISRTQFQNPKESSRTPLIKGEKVGEIETKRKNDGKKKVLGIATIKPNYEQSDQEFSSLCAIQYACLPVDVVSCAD